MSDTSNNSNEQKKCFVAAPIGAEDSEARRATDGLIDEVITPVLEEFDFEVEIGHRVYKSGSITSQLINSLLTFDLVITDLTGLNPNVMYELAVRHAKRLPVIMIAEYGTILPFDINNERTFYYKNDFQGSGELKRNLKSAIEFAIDEPVPDNPIYRAAKTNIMQDVAADNFQDYVIEKLDSIETLSFSRTPGANIETNRDLLERVLWYVRDDFQKIPRAVYTESEAAKIEAKLRHAVGLYVFQNKRDEHVMDLSLEGLVNAFIDAYHSCQRAHARAGEGYQHKIQTLQEEIERLKGSK